MSAAPLVVNGLVLTGVSGTMGKSWPGDLWKTGGAATWLGGTYDAKTGPAYFGTGNPAPGTATCARATTSIRAPRWPST